jgi:ATP-dependent protease ClpP protease subunit
MLPPYYVTQQQAAAMRARAFRAKAAAVAALRCPRCGARPSYAAASRFLSCPKCGTIRRVEVQASAEGIDLERRVAAEKRSMALGLAAAAAVAEEFGNHADALKLRRASQETIDEILGRNQVDREAAPAVPREAVEPSPAAPIARYVRPMVTGGIGEVNISGGIDSAAADRLVRDVGSAAEDGARVLLLTINSEGGHLESTERMIAALHGFPGPVVVSIPDFCASAATLLALAGDYVVMRPGAAMLIHEPTGGSDEERAAWREHMLNVYSSSTGLNDMTCRERFNGGDMRLDASEALARHFIDDTGDRYHARGVAEQFGAGRPPRSGRMVVKAIKQFTAGRQ